MWFAFWHGSTIPGSSGEGGAGPVDSQTVLLSSPLCRFTLSYAAFFFWGGGGGGGGRRRRQQLEFSNLSFLKVFTDYLAPDDTSGVLSIISVEKSAACDLRVPYVALSGLGRIFWGYFPPQPGSDYGGRRHSLWRCVRALWGHWQVSVALLISLIVLWLTLVFGLSNYLLIISYDYGTRADACTQTHAPKAW